MYKLIVVILLSLSAKIQAFEVLDLYQASVAVKSKNEQERIELYPQVLEKVLLKIVGDSQLLASHDLDPLLANATNLVKQYQYRHVNDEVVDLTQPEQLELVVSFDKTNLDQDIQQLGLPLWNTQRPTLLLWLVLDNGTDKIVLGPEHQHEKLQQAISDITNQRGLPIIRPLMDIQDQQLSYGDLVQVNVEKLSRASQRYDTNSSLVVIARQQSNQWQVDWHWLMNEQLNSEQTHGELKTALESGVDSVMTQLARRFSRYASSSIDESRYQLHISNIVSFADYVKVIDYLSSLQEVASVRVTSMVEQQLEVDVALKSELALFNKTLTFDNVLQADTLQVNTDLIRYRFIP